MPPPPSHVREAMADWELFANEDLQMPPLVQCALLHYQFEAIHPYLDGNGRIGRLIIILFLCATKVLPVPLLYLSAYFERDRQTYYDQLLNVSVTGDWNAWLDYFLRGIVQQSHDSVSRVRQMLELQEEHQSILLSKRSTANALALADLLFTWPYITAPVASEILGITNAGARRILDRLAEAGLIRSVPDTWPRIYVAQRLVDIIDAAEAAPRR